MEQHIYAVKRLEAITYCSLLGHDALPCAAEHEHFYSSLLSDDICQPLCCGLIVMLTN